MQSVSLSKCRKEDREHHPDKITQSERKKGKKERKECLLMRLLLTLLWGKTMKAPPPADSTMMARNLGLTAQKVESQEDLETLMLS